MTLCKTSLTVESPIKSGQSVNFCGTCDEVPAGWVTTNFAMPSLRVGDHLECEGAEFVVTSARWLPRGAGHASMRAYVLEALADVGCGQWACVVSRRGFTLAWITLSDKGAAGKRTDESGPLIGKMVDEVLGLALVQGFVIPDEPLQLKGLLSELALVQGFDLIMTTGGTGVGPRDITPEATLAVIERRLPGYERVMTAASLEKTPHGAISRAVAGTLGQGLIVNMPGSPKAVAECLAPLLPTLKHTLEKLQGDPSDCALLRK